VEAQLGLSNGFSQLAQINLDTCTEREVVEGGAEVVRFYNTANMYVCMYIRMYACMHVYIYVSMLYIHTYIHIHTYVIRMYVCQCYVRFVCAKILSITTSNMLLSVKYEGFYFHF